MKDQLLALVRCVFTDPDFVPFEPPERPLGLLGLRTLLRNYIETIPRSAYEQSVTRIRTRLSDVLIVSDPNIIQEILVEKAEAFGRDPATRRSFAPVIGDTSLFLAEGADWRWQRRAVAPIFRHETLLSFVPIFATMAQRQVERWRAVQRAVPIDAAAAMTHTTFEIIVETMLGGSASLDAERYSRALTDNFDTIPWHIIYVMFSIPDWMPYPHRRRAMQSRDFLHRDIRRIVESRRSIQSSQPDLLNLLLAARDYETGRSMSDDEIVANLLTFITAGHETTAVALTWTLWLLAKDQATQQRVFEEVRAVAGDQMIDATHVEGFAARLSRKRCGYSRRHRESRGFRRTQWKSGACRSLHAHVSTFLFSRCIGTSVFGTILMRSIQIALRQIGLKHVRAMPFCHLAADRVSALEQDSL